MDKYEEISRLGRPRLPSSARRDERVVTMVTSEELFELRRLAEQSGKSVSSLCHDLITRTLVHFPPEATSPRRSKPEEK